jgi:hypothetical protein
MLASLRQSGSPGCFPIAHFVPDFCRPDASLPLQNPSIPSHPTRVLTPLPLTAMGKMDTPGACLGDLVICGPAKHADYQTLDYPQSNSPPNTTNATGRRFWPAVRPARGLAAAAFPSARRPPPGLAGPSCRPPAVRRWGLPGRPAVPPPSAAWGWPARLPSPPGLARSAAWSPWAWVVGSAPSSGRPLAPLASRAALSPCSGAASGPPFQACA